MFIVYFSMFSLTASVMKCTERFISPLILQSGPEAVGFRVVRPSVRACMPGQMHFPTGLLHKGQPQTRAVSSIRSSALFRCLRFIFSLYIRVISVRSIISASTEPNLTKPAVLVEL